jgi:hypothetical protein
MCGRTRRGGDQPLWTASSSRLVTFLRSLREVTVRIGIDESALARAAMATDAAATLVAAVSVAELPAAISGAMPGSRSAATADQAAMALADAVAVIARELLRESEALRMAALHYGDAEHVVAEAARQTSGAA